MSGVQPGGVDFGMCHAVNVGTVQGFRDGIVTQAIEDRVITLTTVQAAFSG